MIALRIVIGLLSFSVAFVICWHYGRKRAKRSAYRQEVADIISDRDNIHPERWITEPRITECSLSGLSFLSPYGHCPSGGESHCFRALLEADARLRHPTRNAGAPHGGPGRDVTR